MAVEKTKVKQAHLLRDLLQALHRPNALLNPDIIMREESGVFQPVRQKKANQLWSA